MEPRACRKTYERREMMFGHGHTRGAAELSYGIAHPKSCDPRLPADPRSERALPEPVPPRFGARSPERQRVVFLEEASAARTVGRRSRHLARGKRAPRSDGTDGERPRDASSRRNLKALREVRRRQGLEGAAFEVQRGAVLSSRTRRVALLRVRAPRRQEHGSDHPAAKTRCHDRSREQQRCPPHRTGRSTDRSRDQCGSTSRGTPPGGTAGRLAASRSRRTSAPNAGSGLRRQLRKTRDRMRN
jgi:hypothetical protein